MFENEINKIGIIKGILINSKRLSENKYLILSTYLNLLTHARTRAQWHARVITNLYLTSVYVTRADT